MIREYCFPSIRLPVRWGNCGIITHFKFRKNLAIRPFPRFIPRI